MRVRDSGRFARNRLQVAIAAMTVALAGCGTQSAPTSAPGAASAAAVSPLATVEPTASAKPTAVPRIPAPAELQGRWRTVINDADKPVLTITDFTYTILRLGIGTGSIEVTGSQIRFFASNLCQGDGTYTWSITGDTLTLVSVTPDPCANRADAIRGRPFTRME